MTNCLSVPIDDLLKNGFRVRQTDIRPAGSLNTALQLVAVLFQIQSLQQFGGVAATHIDHSMVPYVRKSFRKHYLHHWIMSLEEFDELDILGISHTELQHWVENKLTEFFLKNDFKDEDFKFNNEILKSTVELNKLHQKALFSTKKECYQGIEALYHNLNSLQSRSGCLMVKDCRRAA